MDRKAEVQELSLADLDKVSGGFGMLIMAAVEQALKNSDGPRSQAEKRLEQQRKDLTRNWGG